MRTKKTILDTIASVASNVVAILAGIVAQSLFIKILGKEYLGLNSLFSNIISMLSIAELGIGSAIIYNLYKPIVNNDKNTINKILLFYKKCYCYIFLAVLILGLAILPFLSYFLDINSAPQDINVYIVYLLFLFDSLASYLFSYKSSLLYASQNNYIIRIVHIFYTISLNTLQLLYLAMTKDYYGYVAIKTIIRLLENIIITHITNKCFSYISQLNKSGSLPKDIQQDIKKKVKGSIFHKIGAYVVICTDNIIISKFIDLATVGLYSNYYLIINSVKTVFNQVIQATTASIGNLLVTSDTQKQLTVFKRIRFINFWLAVFSGAAIFVIIQSFIPLWVGKDYLLPLSTLLVLIINYYLNATRTTYGAFKDAAGIQYEDRFVPIIESVLNIVFSITFVQLIGLPGVFIGTLISSLALWCYSYPKFIYKGLLKQSYLKYAVETLGYMAAYALILFVTYYIAISINTETPFAEFIKNCIVAVLIPNTFVILIYHRSDNFKYCTFLAKKAIHKITKKDKAQ